MSAIRTVVAIAAVVFLAWFATEHGLYPFFNLK